MGRRCVAALCSIIVLAVSGRAHAQSASPLPPKQSDDGASGSGMPRPEQLLAPVRLSLKSGLFPTQGVYNDCTTHEGASGNSVNGFALERYGFARLIPRLSIYGFSSAGCPLDSGVGGAMTYAIPLKRSMWLVPSVGVYAQPGPDRVTSPTLTTVARVDVVKQLAWGRTLSFGIGARARTGTAQFPALSFGGSF